MGRNVAAAIAGVVFGVGLAVSQMVNPAKVLGFLDIAGSWDPSLAFVMGGAVAVTWVAFRYVARRSNPVLGGEFALPRDTAIDTRLLGGAALFGVGWGLVGLCPGPAIASVAFGNLDSVLFVGAMILGMALVNLLPAKPAPLATTES